MMPSKTEVSQSLNAIRMVHGTILKLAARLEAVVDDMQRAHCEAIVVSNTKTRDKAIINLDKWVSLATRAILTQTGLPNGENGEHHEQPRPKRAAK